MFFLSLQTLNAILHQVQQKNIYDNNNLWNSKYIDVSSNCKVCPFCTKNKVLGRRWCCDDWGRCWRWGRWSQWHSKATAASSKSKRHCVIVISQSPHWYLKLTLSVVHHILIALYRPGASSSVTCVTSETW